MNIALNTLREVAMTLTEPYLVAVLVLLALLLHRQNKKTTIMQKMIIGESIDSAFELTVSQIVMGIFAGTLASLICAYLGIVFGEGSAIDLIFLFSVILMFISPRLVCFSYSGAALGLASIILSQLSMAYKDTVVHIYGTAINMNNIDILAIDIGAMMSLIAVLHFVEGLLVIIDGRRGAIPVFTNREDKIIGGFAIKRNWILPIAVLVLTQQRSVEFMDKAITMPLGGWYPLVNISFPYAALSAALIVPVAFFGVVGYNSVTFTKTKAEKTLSSGLWIIAYSIILFLVAQTAKYGVVFQLITITFAAAAHEFMLRVQRNKEMNSIPKYVSNGEGLKILETAPNSPAAELKIATGDEILSINNMTVKDEVDLQNALGEASHYLWIKLRKSQGEVVELNYNSYNSTKRLGVVFVPRNIPKESMVVKLDNNKFHEVLNKIRSQDVNKDSELDLPDEVKKLIDDAMSKLENDEDFPESHEGDNSSVGSEQNKSTEDSTQNKNQIVSDKEKAEDNSEDKTPKKNEVMPEEKSHDHNNK